MVLVKFIEDGIIYDSRRVIRRGNQLFAVYKDGRYYRATQMKDASLVKPLSHCKMIATKSNRDTIGHYTRSRQNDKVASYGVLKGNKAIGAKISQEGKEDDEKAMKAENEDDDDTSQPMTYKSTSILISAIEEERQEMEEDHTTQEKNEGASQPVKNAKGDGKYKEGSYASQEEVEDKDETIAEGNEHEDVDTNQAISITVGEGKTCIYCLTSVAKLARHISFIHKEEPEVKEIMENFPVGSKERRKFFILKGRQATFYNNLNTLDAKFGTLVVGKYPHGTESKNPHDYGPCPQCLGFFRFSSLWRHIKQCPEKSSLFQKPERPQMASLCMLGLSRKYDENFQKSILDKISPDLRQIIKGDETILSVGFRLFSKHFSNQSEYIRFRMRSLAKVLIEFRGLKNDTALSVKDMINTQNFPQLCQIAIKLAGNSGNTNLLKSPATALKVGFNLQLCAHALQSEALRNKDTAYYNELDMFLKLYDKDWAIYVTPRAYGTLKNQKLNSVDQIPCEEDFVAASSFIETYLRDKVQELNSKQTVKTYAEAAKALLCRLISYNFRRAGETARLKVADYQKAISSDDNRLNFVCGENDLEKAKNRTVIETIGKRGRIVCIIVRPQWLKFFDSIFKARLSIGVDHSNQYFFAVPGTESSYIQGSKAMREVIALANDSIGLSEERLLTSTKLRKYFSTVVQSMELSVHDRERITDHMGHSKQVSEEFYRKKPTIYEKTVVADLLDAVQGGIRNIRGKRLRDVNVCSKQRDEGAIEPVAGCSRDAETTGMADPDDQLPPMKRKGRVCTRSRQEPTDTHSELDDIQMEPDEFCPTDSDDSYEPPPESSPSHRTPEKKQKGKKERDYVQWTPETRGKVLSHFKKNLMLSKVPGKAEIDNCARLLNISSLKNKHWKKVKDLIYNTIKKRKAQLL